MSPKRSHRLVHALFLATAAVPIGCANRHAVVASTGTSIGVEVAQNPANQTPHAKLGYQRLEVAIVPTNRSGDIDPGGANGPLDHGAADSTDVLMELRYSGIFSMGDGSGIYQRLAVGKNAVTESGAAVLFGRDNSGRLTESETVRRYLDALPQ